MVPIGDKIGDMPGQTIERFSGQAERFVSGDSWFHDDLFERRSLHEGPGFLQGMKRCGSSFVKRRPSLVADPGKNSCEIRFTGVESAAGGIFSILLEL